MPTEKEDEAELVKIQEEMNKKLETAKELQRQIGKLKDENLKSGQTEYDRLVKLNDLEQKKLDALKEDLVTRIKTGEIAAASLRTDAEGLKIQNALREQYKALGIDILALADEHGDSAEAMEEIELKINAAHEKRIELKKEEKKHSENVKSLNDKIAGSLGIQTVASKTISGQAANMAKSLVMGGEGTLAILSDTFNLKNIMANVVDEVIKIAIGLDDASKSFGKMTGFGNQMAGTFQDVYASTIAAGGTIEEANQAMGALANNFAAFNPKAEAANEYMATNLVLMQKIGVDSVGAAKSMDFFTKAMGKSAKQATDMTREIAMMGKTMGVTASKMISDFQAVSGDIAMYGNRTMDVFKNLAAQAKATGVEMSSLVAVGKQFDTFEGAADVSAKLNAVLGTSISTIDMMNMSYDQRIEYLKQEMRSVGANMDSMDPYTQMYVAQALGVGSVAEAQKLLNASQADIDANRRKQEEANKRQEELLELTTQLVPMAHQLSMAFAQMALVMSPVISFLTAMFEGISVVNSAMHGMMIPTIMALIVIWGVWTSKIKLATIATGAYNLWQGLKLILLKSTTAGTILSTAAENGSVVAKIALAIAAKIAAGGLTAMGTALVFATGGLILILPIIFALIGAFYDPHSPPFYLIFGVIAIAIIGFGFAIMGVMPVIMGLILGVVAAAIAMVTMFNAIKSGAPVAMEMFQMFIDNTDVLPQIADGIMSIAVAIGALGVATAVSLSAVLLLFAATSGLGAVLVGIGMIGGGLMLAALAVSMERIGTGMKNFGAGLAQIKSITSELNAATANGFLAVRTDGSATSMILGSNEMIKNFVDGNITVDVNIPEMKIPKTEVNVYLDGKKMEGIVKKVISRAG